MSNCSQPADNTNKLIHQQTNTRIYDRNIPSQMLQPYLDVRPVMTKYSYFPIVDPRKNINVPLTVQPTFNPHKVFNPGNTTSPWSGFASNVNTESELRNQIYQGCSNEHKGQKNYGLGIRMINWETGQNFYFHNGWWHGNTSAYITLQKEHVTIIALSNKMNKSTYNVKKLAPLFGDYPFETDTEE